MARVLYFVATGPSDPTRVSVALHLAVNGTAEAGHEADVAFGGDAAELIKPGVADSVVGVGVPPFAELLTKAASKGVRFHV